MKPRENEEFEVRIRPMQPDDRSFILGLTYRLSESAAPTSRNEDTMQVFHQRYGDETAEVDVDGQIVLVAEDTTGRRLGVIHVIRAIDHISGEEQGYLSTIAIGSDGGRHVAPALMAAAESWARRQGLRTIILDVSASNLRARRFYHHLGFDAETIKMVKKL